jgi:hypothetical protein
MENLMGKWVGFERAYQIALVGNFSIRVIYNNKYKNGIEEYQLVKEFFKDAKYSSDGELTVELYEPSSYTPGGISYKDLVDEVSKFKGKAHPTVFRNSSCDVLLKNAKDRLELSLNAEQMVRKVAGVIALIDGSKDIAPEHVAEAIQYRHEYLFEGYYTAEDGDKWFGKGIRISPAELYSSDIEEAIEYLKSKL